MKKLWKTGSLSLALAVGIVAGAAMAASGTPAQRVEEAPGPQSLGCPSPAECSRADRLCKDYDLTPGYCQTLSECLACEVVW